MNSEILFSALNNPIRLRLLMLIAAHGELCVCELTHALELSQPAISRHLALLRQAGVIEDRRQAQWVYYQLANTTPLWVREVLAATMKGNTNQEPFVGDNALLESMPNRPEAMQCC